MDRYDFIRFGEQVRWYNESEDLMETMQVCCPYILPCRATQGYSWYQPE